MGIENIYDPEENRDEPINSVESQLVSWVMSHVRNWEDHRNNNYEQRWNEYYRLWRGVWKKEDQTRDTERSRLISPATAQAIEVQAAEIEEAIFGKGKWFDVSDDVEDVDKMDLQLFREKLLEDLTEHGYPRAISEIVLNGCIYGTGIGKIQVEMVQEMEFNAVPGGEYSDTPDLSPNVVDKVMTTLIPVEPREFVIDPVATTIDEAMGCAHILEVPRHVVMQKMQSGEYRMVPLGNHVNDFDYEEKGEIQHGFQDQVKLIEYHGLVPEILISQVGLSETEGDELEPFYSEEGGLDEDEAMVMAIVHIANDGELMKAVRNPHAMQDSDFVAYQHDTVPNRFWGRGVAEKGYNPQKALDAELRGRIDAMSLAIHPMMAVDGTRIPRGGDFSVRPGKTVVTTGDPREVLHPFNFGQVGTNTFQESGDLERMIQMATGAMDSAAPISSNPRNNTLGGMSIMQSSAIKRSKRTLANIENQFLKPLIKKSAYRLMQFAPSQYPPVDPKFIVNSTLGIMARELEMQQMSSLLGTTQDGTPGWWMLMSNIYELSSVSNRESMMALANQQLQNSLQPKEDPMVAVKQAELQMKQQAEMAKLQIENSRAETERMRVEKELMQVEPQIAKLQAEISKIQVDEEKARRSTIVETEKQITASQQKDRELDQKDKEIALKNKELDVKVTLEQNKILAEKDMNDKEMAMKQMELEMQEKEQANNVETAKASKPDAPVININSATKKKIEVVRTANGLEGTSEEID